MKEPWNEFEVALVENRIAIKDWDGHPLSRSDARVLAYWLIKEAGEFAEDSDGMTEALRELVNLEQREAAQLTCSRCGHPRPTLLMPYCNTCYSIIARELGNKRY